MARSKYKPKTDEEWQEGFKERYPCLAPYVQFSGVQLLAAPTLEAICKRLAEVEVDQSS